MAYENLKSTGIKYLLTRLKDYFVQIKDAVRTVNNTAPVNGNVTIDTVPYANDLVSDRVQTSRETYQIRATSGSTPIATGDAWLMGLVGNSVHEGFVAEEIDPSSTSESISNLAVNRNTFVSKVDQTGTVPFTYSNNAWDVDPATYGVTYNGTPTNGDTILVSYIKEVPGTIYQSNPQRFVSTKWNLYYHESESSGYAHVIRYSGDHTFRIDGSYTSLMFSTTPSGSGQAITVTDGNFDPFANTDADEGYVLVTGGNSTDTAIYMTWGDWTDESKRAEFATYGTSEIDLTPLIGTTVEDAPFPYGLLNVGSVSDEINLNLGTYTQRVERMENTPENLANARSSGREFDYDEDFIYIAMETPITRAIDDDHAVDGAYLADDHGMEWFEDSDAPVTALSMYGNNLKNKLETDVVTFSEHVYNGLNKTDEGFVLDARQGKVLNSKITQLYKKTVTGTPSSTGSLSSGLNTSTYYIISARISGSNGFAFWRGNDAYVVCYNLSLQPITTSITLEIVYCKRSELGTE